MYKRQEWFTVFDYPVRFIHRPHLYANTYKVGWDGNQEEYKQYLDKTFEETKVPVEIKDDDGPIVEPSFKAWWGVPDMPKINFESKEARPSLPVVETPATAPPLRGVAGVAEIYSPPQAPFLTAAKSVDLFSLVGAGSDSPNIALTQ